MSMVPSQMSSQDMFSFSKPTADESVAGSTYIPKEPADFVTAVPNMPAPAQSPEDEMFSKQLAQSAKGQASGVNDFDLTMAGIAYGDPVGMETFDLGFFEDGTPAIAINGVNIPIRPDQWMSMLQTRQRARDEFKQRMEFEVQRKNAKTTISTLTKAVPNLPTGMAEALMAYADMNPPAALQETMSLLPNNAADNNRTQLGRIRADMKSNEVGAVLSRINASIEVPHPKYQTEVIKTTPKFEASSRLKSDQDPKKRASAYAIENIELLAPNPALMMLTGGQPVGFMDNVVASGMDMNEFGNFSMLRNMASDSGGLFPAENAVPWFEFPQMDPSAMPDAQTVSQIKNYLRRLDMWAYQTLRWDMSSDQSLNALVEQIIGIQRNRSVANQKANEQKRRADQSPTTPTTLPASEDSDL